MFHSLPSLNATSILLEIYSHAVEKLYEQEEVITVFNLRVYRYYGDRFFATFMSSDSFSLHFEIIRP
jgi:hypothetical protein